MNRFLCTSLLKFAARPAAQSSRKLLRKSAQVRRYSANSTNPGQQSSLTRNLVIGGTAILGIGAGYMTYKYSQVPESAYEPVNVQGKRLLPPFATKDANIPQSVPYLLVGGGTASFAAFRSIKARDPTAKVVVVSNEEHLPYLRPPLSKDMWFVDDPAAAAETLSFKTWNGRDRSILYEPEEFFVAPQNLLQEENGGVAVVRGRRIVKIDPNIQEATFENGYKITYGKCLIATGGVPKEHTAFETDDIKMAERIISFRSVDDFRRLERVSRGAGTIAIVGGGFLGSELACALGKRSRDSGGKLKVVQLFPESGNLGLVLPEYLSEWTTKMVQAESVTVMPDVNVEKATWDTGHVNLHLTNGSKLTADYIVVAVGLDPNTQLAAASGLELDPELGGVRVNAEMQASRSNIWVAGDAACFYDETLGRRRVEHHEHAVVSGRIAGANMAGARKHYLHQSSFWSDLGPLVSFQALGLIDANLPTVGVYAKPEDKEGNAPLPAKGVLSLPPPSADYNRGILFYLKNDTVVGILLWNLANQMQVARRILQGRTKLADLSEAAKLFDLHDEDQDRLEEEQE